MQNQNEKEVSSVVKLNFLEGDLGSGQFQIPVIVDGAEVVFQLDTGSNYTAMAYTSLVAKYPVTGTIRSTSAAGVAISNDKIKLASFKIGSIQREDFEVVRYQPNSPLNNRIGMNGINTTLLNFDMKHNVLNFGKIQPQGLQQFQLRVDKNLQFGMDVTVGDKVVGAIWDTGAELSVVDRDFLASHPEQFKFLQKIDNGVDATGNKVEFELYQASNILVGDKLFSGAILAMDFKMMAEAFGPSVKLILGTNFIRGHNWYFDQKNKSWAVE